MADGSSSKRYVPSRPPPSVPSGISAIPPHLRVRKKLTPTEMISAIPAYLRPDKPSTSDRPAIVPSTSSSDTSDLILPSSTEFVLKVKV